jgi:ribulose-phosphate 3-epimerase
MTVYAGFGGQKFMPEMLPKIKAIANEIRTFGLSLDLEVDGGIVPETARLCAQNGANVFVAGSFVFRARPYSEPITAIRIAAEDAWKSDR